MPLWKKVPPDRSARPRSILTGHDGSAEAVAIAPDGTWLVTTSWDGTARIWAANGKPRATLTGHKEAVEAVAIAPDGTWLVTASWDGTARIWATDGALRATLTGHGGSVDAVAIAPDGTWLATASDDKTARTWAADGTHRATLSGHTEGVQAVAIAPDGAWLATASDDGTARIWAADGTPRATLTGHTDGLWAVAIAPDGTWLATTSGDQTARIWAADGTPRATLTGHAAPLFQRVVQAVAIAPDGTWLATASWDKTARIWAADGTPRATLTGHKSPVTGVAIAPDGTWLATTSGDQTARIWAVDCPPAAGNGEHASDAVRPAGAATPGGVGGPGPGVEKALAAGAAEAPASDGEKANSEPAELQAGALGSGNTRLGGCAAGQVVQRLGRAERGVDREQAGLLLPHDHGLDMPDRRGEATRQQQAAAAREAEASPGAHVDAAGVVVGGRPGTGVLGGEQVTGEPDRVAADIEERPTGQLRRHPDIGVPLGHGEMEVRLDLPQIPDHTVGNQLAEPPHLVVEREDEGLPERGAGLAGHGEDLLRLGQRARQRLLAQNGLAGPQRPDRPLPVQRVRQRDVQGVHPRVVDQLLIADDGPADGVVARPPARPVGVAACHGGGLPARLAHRRQEVLARDPRRADDSPAHCRHLAATPRPGSCGHYSARSAGRSPVIASRQPGRGVHLPPHWRPAEPRRRSKGVAPTAECGGRGGRERERTISHPGWRRRGPGGSHDRSVPRRRGRAGDHLR